MVDLLMKMPVSYEPKRNNRWILTMKTMVEKPYPSFKELPPWVVFETSRPKFKKQRFWLFWTKLVPDVLEIKMVDPIGPSITQVIHSYVTNESILNYDLEMLDPTGVVIEKWEIGSCEILEVDFGFLDYGDDKITTLSMKIKPKTVKLLY